MAIQISKEQIKNAAIDASKLDQGSSVNYSFAGQIRYTGSDTNDQALATRGYVDSVAAGLDPKDSCKVATTGNITLSGTQTIDGVSVVADDRVLVKDQTTGTENGIYLCKTGSWVRADDLATGADAAGASMFIQDGTSNADKGFVCTSNSGSAVVGTDALTFSQFTGASNITAGDGLTKTGDTLDVNVDDSTIEIASDALRVKDQGITSSKIANGAVGNQQLAGNIGAGKLQLGNGVRDASGSLEIDLDGSTLDVGANGLKVAQNGITNTELAGSIAADKLNLGDGVRNNAGNLVIDLDGSTLSASGNGVRISDGGVGTTQLADDAVTAAKIADGEVGESALAANAVTVSKIANDAVTSSKINFSAAYERLSDGNGSTTTFDASSEADTGMVAGTIVFRNGLAITTVAPGNTPSGQDECSLAPDGGTNGALRITFGSAPNNGDVIAVMYFKL